MPKTIREIRLENLRALRAEHPTEAAFGNFLGMAPAQVWQLLNNKRGVGDKLARKIEQRVGKPRGWMDGSQVSPSRDLVEESQGEYLPRPTRFVPVISDIEAGNPREVFDDHEPGNGFETVAIDPEIAGGLGPYAFGLVISGMSMADEFQPGDRVIIDPDAAVRPGDIVVAKVERHDAATLKKYRSRGHDDLGNEIIELLPLNEDYAPVVIDSTNPGRIIGPVVEHRRRFNRNRGG